MEKREYDSDQVKERLAYSKYSKVTLLSFYLYPGYPGNVITFLHYSLQASFAP